MPTKIYSFGLTTFGTVRSSPLSRKKNKYNKREKFSPKAFVVVGKLIRRSEACAANWYTLTLHWFPGCLERAPLETETKGGQKGINPRTRGEGHPKFLLGYLGEILSGDKDNARLIMKRNESWAWNLFVLLNLFMSLFDCTETMPAAGFPAPNPVENHSSANGNGRPLKLALT